MKGKRRLFPCSGFSFTFSNHHERPTMENYRFLPPTHSRLPLSLHQPPFSQLWWRSRCSCVHRTFPKRSTLEVQVCGFEKRKVFPSTSNAFSCFFTSARCNENLCRNFRCAPHYVESDNCRTNAERSFPSSRKKSLVRNCRIGRALIRSPRR